MENIDLSKTTIIIPVKIEHRDRYRNAKCTLNFLNRYLNTNVFIFEVSSSEESRLDFLGELTNLNIKHWICPEEDSFHRTKYLNLMLDEVETPVVINYDIDVLLSPSNYLGCQNRILSNEASVIYPYELGMGQYQVMDSFDYQGFYDSGFSYDFLSRGDNLNTFPAECGHCIFFNTEIYRKFGGENEDFISYGPEDKERVMRFKKLLGDGVQWVPGEKVFHFEHYRSEDSSPYNPYFGNNWAIYEKISKMSLEEMDDYYSSIEYRKKYKNI